MGQLARNQVLSAAIQSADMLKGALIGFKQRRLLLQEALEAAILCERTLRSQLDRAQKEIQATKNGAANGKF